MSSTVTRTPTWSAVWRTRRRRRGSGTLVPTALRSAAGMNIAYPGGMCMLASIMNRLAVATPIEVLM